MDRTIGIAVHEASRIAAMLSGQRARRLELDGRAIAYAPARQISRYPMENPGWPT
jgi:hypothetical protein